MLTCKDVTARASALLEGELGFRDRLGVRMHLAMCVHCRRFIRQLRLLLNRLSLQTSDQDAVSEAFVERVLGSVKQDTAGDPKLNR